MKRFVILAVAVAGVLFAASKQRRTEADRQAATWDEATDQT